jgi:hypothetical protein
MSHVCVSIPQQSLIGNCVLRPPLLAWRRSIRYITLDMRGNSVGIFCIFVTHLVVVPACTRDHSNASGRSERISPQDSATRSSRKLQFRLLRSSPPSRTNKAREESRSTWVRRSRLGVKTSAGECKLPPRASAYSAPGLATFHSSRTGLERRLLTWRIPQRNACQVPIVNPQEVAGAPLVPTSTPQRVPALTA